MTQGCRSFVTLQFKDFLSTSPLQYIFFQGPFEDQATECGSAQHRNIEGYTGIIDFGKTVEV